ncbi:uncharacterized protein FOMMEDRAFT_138002 [Fomitiporia mediterranea MF3/22]|uniref:uncharacterized protein n=1 Tax=Fomitiporia mediterranea (strain MF3/22) TaxID=694068 RepID=UPI0004409670|nr:uncharacterized protein FOMMEDRAFT_138002 [Fomitiporia mediterranea MF3/22]EJD07860.1 hypothetical protein FOMMEDRAFT_138002 [Fomitiporia mediterranea MF3/22]
MCLKGNVETMHSAFYIDEELKREMAMSPVDPPGGRTLRIAHERPLDTEENAKRRVEICEQFVRLHFEVFLRQCSLSNRRKENRDEACLNLDQVAITLRSRVKDRLRQVLNDRQVEDIWNNCIGRPCSRVQENSIINGPMLTEGLYTTRLQDLLTAASL